MKTAKQKPEYSKVDTTEDSPTSVELISSAKPAKTGEQKADFFRIVAPCSLLGGFCFVAEFQGKSYKVSVPRGGVLKGTKFTPVILHEIKGRTNDLPQAGAWEDGLCDCCNDESCVSACVCGVCILPHLEGVVENRLEGEPEGNPLWCLWSFVYMAMIVVVFLLVTSAGPNVRSSDEELAYQCRAIQGILGLILVFAVCCTRGRLREQLAIEGDECTDCLSAWCCTCCTVLQMWRHVKMTKPTGQKPLGKIRPTFVVAPGGAKGVNIV